MKKVSDLRPFAKNRIRALSRLSNVDPKEKSPAPSYYSEHMRSVDIEQKTWKSEIKAALLPFDPEEYYEGNIIDKEREFIYTDIWQNNFEILLFRISSTRKCLEGYYLMAKMIPFSKANRMTIGQA